jgi:hypothetical protein
MHCRPMLSKCFLTMLALSSSLALADELKWTHYGVRPLAMGNAYVAVADDYNALFYNPAGLARLESWHGELLNPQVGASSTTISTIKTFSGLARSSSDGVNSTLTAFEALSGKPQWINVGLTPHLVFPGFGLGIGMDVGASMTVHRTISADVVAGTDIIVPIAYAKNFLEDRLSLGVAVKGVFTSGVNREFSLADITAFSKKEAGSSGAQLKDFVVGGKGVGVDLGMLFTPVTTGEPTLGVSIADVGGTPYKAMKVGSANLGTPKPRTPSFNTGISYKPIKTDHYYVLTTMDAHAINQPIHFSKKLNFGTEWGFGRVLKLQAGLHQGSFSGGFQLDAWILVLRFATYTEQIGHVAGESTTAADRRYLAQLKILI